MTTRKMIIIGSGPAGFTAAIYAARANLAPLMIAGFQKGGMPGGQLMTTGEVENFPGFPNGITGQQLMDDMKKQAETFGNEYLMEDVDSVVKDGNEFVVKTATKEFRSRTVVISTGAVAKRLPLESEKQFWNKGISACAVCDGALPIFRNKELAVIGGGDSAVEEADHLTQFGTKVYLIHRRDELRASKIMAKRAEDHPKIEILWNKTVEEFLGDNTLTGLKLKDTVTGDISEISVGGAFEAIGHTPNTDFLNGLVELDDKGYIITAPDSTKTNVEGLFAAGDVQDAKYRQAVTAAGSGCMAALEAEHWLAANPS